MKIAAFSKYLGYQVGGAERSLIHHLREMERKEGAHITLIYCEGLKTFAASRHRVAFSPTWQVIPLPCKFRMNAFFYTEYCLNKRSIESFFEAFETDILYAQGLWAPAAINAFAGKSVRFIRDEMDLNIWNNYHTGFRKIAKRAYQWLEHPAFACYCGDNRNAMKKADIIIANSEYMANEVVNRFGRQPRVQYPPIEMESLRNRYRQAASAIPADKKAVVMVGETVIKGIGLFHNLARQFPAEPFMVFGRSYKEEKKVGNVTYMPWQNDLADVYKWAKLVLVPSLWNEAFGRVAAEARGLGIPVIVSNRGGLPEAVNGDAQSIANDDSDMFIKLARNLKKGSSPSDTREDCVEESLLFQGEPYCENYL